MTKHCNKCNTDKPIELFYRNNRKKDGVQSSCKSCSNAYSKAHFNKDRQVYREKSKRLKALNTDRVRQRKAGPCTDCGVQYPYYIMEFDHLGDKNFSISDIQYRNSTQKLLKEMDKCEVVCRNCHAERTALRAGYSCPVSSTG